MKHRVPLEYLQSSVSQQGGSTLLAVMLMLATGLMLLTAQQRQVDSAVLLLADQQQYLKATHQAASALSWGQVQAWPRRMLSSKQWFCLTMPQETLTACARLASQPGVIMLRGQGPLPKSDPLWLYQLAREAQGTERLYLQPEQSGWLDICPAKRATDCAD